MTLVVLIVAGWGGVGVGGVSVSIYICVADGMERSHHRRGHWKSMMKLASQEFFPVLEAF